MLPRVPSLARSRRRERNVSPERTATGFVFTWTFCYYGRVAHPSVVLFEVRMGTLTLARLPDVSAPCGCYETRWRTVAVDRLCSSPVAAASESPARQCRESESGTNRVRFSGKYHAVAQPFYPVLCRPAAIPLIVAPRAKLRVSVFSPARFLRRRSTWTMLMGST
jgi:hypothetical protein